MQSLLLPAITSFLSALTAWLFARAKNKRDLKSQDIDNEMKSAKYYQVILDDLTNRLETTINELNKLEKKYDALMDKNNELVSELKKFKQLNGKKN